jgi:hypothetical protein
VKIRRGTSPRLSLFFCSEPVAWNALRVTNEDALRGHGDPN